MAQLTSKRDKQVSTAQEAVDKLWEDYALGLEIRKNCPMPTKSGSGAMERINMEAERLEINSDVVRKLRQMVDPENGYTKSEFKALCKCCLEHDCLLGRTHVFKFFTVPKGPQRLAFQLQAIKQGWTLARVRQELRRQFGHRRHGGRRPRLPVNVPDALSQLDGMCLAWKRWCDLVAEGADEGQKLVAIEDLPDPVRDRLVQVTNLVRDLGTAVSVCMEQFRSAGRQGGGSRNRQKPGAVRAGKDRHRRPTAISRGLGVGSGTL